MRKKIIVSVINDLVTDQRVARNCSVLQELNYEVLLVGREQKQSLPLIKRAYECKRMKLFFEQGIVFYLSFNLRLLLLLLFTKADALFANDLDTLLPNYIVSRLKNIPLIYDSHEIFCEVPELQKNQTKKRIWETLEKLIVPKLHFCVTVNNSIAQYFKKKYDVPFIFVRNIPNYTPIEKAKTREDLKLPLHKKIIILQGAGINVQRGAEELVESFTYLSNEYILLIVGSGDVIPQLKINVERFKLNDKVIFINKLSASELRYYSLNADLGVSIDKDTNLNYHFSLPNKVFDYLHAGIPILATRLPEIENLIITYNVGNFIEHHQPKHISEKIQLILNSENYTTYKKNTIIASAENSWATEKQKLINLINSVDYEKE